MTPLDGPSAILPGQEDPRDADIAQAKVEIARLRANLETARLQLWRDWVEGGSDGARQAFYATAHPR